MPAVVNVALALVFDAPRTHVLICQRQPDAVLGGYWEFPGGKCAPGETPTACALRELREEVDVDAEPVAQLAPIEHDYPHASVRLHPVVCVHSGRSAVPRQVAQLRWVRPAELGEYRFPEANTALTRLAAQGYRALVAAAADA